jgi:hypothetical protein
MGYVLWVICYELWVMGYVNLCGMNCVISFMLWVVCYRLWVICYELCVMGYVVW